MPSIYLGDFGTLFEMTVMEGSSVVDLSSTTEVKALFRSSGGLKFEKIVNFKTDGKDGIVQYTTAAGDFITDGTWYLQLRIKFTYGTWRTSANSFVVES